MECGDALRSLDHGAPTPLRCRHKTPLARCEPRGAPPTLLDEERLECASTDTGRSLGVALANLEQMNVASMLKYHRDGALVLDPEFQRGDVWTKPAKVLLIDSVLRGYPIPKIVLRTRLNTATLETMMEVVDGQQRLRAIVEYAADEWPLTPRAREFAGRKYSDLDEADKERFLSYLLGIDNMMGAPDELIVEIFARMNVYTVSLTPPELRHAAYNGRFKDAVLSLAETLPYLWVNWGTFTTRRLVRMAHHSLLAEFFGVLLEGVQDGGETNLDALYKRKDRGAGEITQQEAHNLVAQTAELLRILDDQYREAFQQTRLAAPAHVLTLFTALAHATYGIPQGKIKGPMPTKAPVLDTDTVRERLSRLAAAMELTEKEEAPAEFLAYVGALEQTTRIKSREPRFRTLYSVLVDENLE